MINYYEIQIQGYLDEHWQDWFDGMSITLKEDGTTLLSGPVADQPALYGILRRVRDLGLPLILVRLCDRQTLNAQRVECMKLHAPSQLAALMKMVGWILMLLLAVLLFVLASHYLSLDPDVYFSEQREVYIANTIPLLMHVAGSMLATIIGPFQFLKKLRTGRYSKIHRWLGRLYLIGVLIGGLGGSYLAVIAYGGPMARLGFMSIAGIWLVSGFMAYTNIRNRRIEPHRKWMIVNYAITFAGVTLRLWQMLFGTIGLDFLTSYNIVAWLSWVPNLLIALSVINRDHSTEK